MTPKIREAQPDDFVRLEEILSQNNMLDYPEVDGKGAMQKIHEKAGRYFLVAEEDGVVAGMIRGCYDGSRALIHQMAVDKNYQRQGIGRLMIHELASRFYSDGAPTISVTSMESSKGYYSHLGFSDLPVTVMVGFDIKKVLTNTEPKSPAGNFLL